MPSPALPPGTATADPATSPHSHRAPRPGGLLVILVLAVVLGGGGTCTSVMGLVGVMVQRATFAAQAELLGGGDHDRTFETQRALLERSQEIQQAYLPWTLANALVTLAASALLLVGAVMGLSYRERGRRLLLVAMGVGLVVAFFSTAVGMTVQVETMQAITTSLADLSGPLSGQAPPPGFDRMMGTVVRGIEWVSYAFIVGWLLAKCTYFVVSAWYLRRPDIRALFGADA